MSNPKLFEVPPSVYEVLCSPGQPLDAQTRAPFELHFGQDFSPVRVHTDARAADSARAVSALAYTVGSQIVFGRHQYRPGQTEGMRIIAHELTHVLQQGHARPSGQLILSNPSDALELEADAAARAVRTDAAAASSEASISPSLPWETHGRPVVPPTSASVHGFSAAHHSQPSRMLLRLPAGPGVTLPTTDLPPTEGLPPEMFKFPRIPGEGFGAGFRTATATGEATAGGAGLGQATYVIAEPGSVVTGATTMVAEGPVVVGGTTVGEATLVTGGRFVAGAGATATADVGMLAVLGAIVVVGAVYLVVEAQSHPLGKLAPGEEYPGTSLPGGTSQGGTPSPLRTRLTGGMPLRRGGPSPLYVPGGSPTGPLTTPGKETTPLITPGGETKQVEAPGTREESVTAPGIVDDEATCAKLIKAGVRHDHHIFPREFDNEFYQIYINIDDLTVTLPADKHIGKRGVHATLDWNAVWREFFDKVPARPLTMDEVTRLRQAAFDIAVELMNEAGIERRFLHKYRRQTPSPEQWK